MDEGNHTLEANSFISVTRHSVKAIVRSKEIIVGNENLVLDHNIAIPSEGMLAETEIMVQTGVPMSIDEELSRNTIGVYPALMQKMIL